MDWQAADDGRGDTPGHGTGLPGTPGMDGAPGEPRIPAVPPGLLAGFGHGGAWETAVPSAALAVALETAAGPGHAGAEGAGAEHGGMTGHSMRV